MSYTNQKAIYLLNIGTNVFLRDFTCSQSGKHPQGIYPNLAINKSVIILLYFRIYIENQIQKSGNFYLFHNKNLAIETLPPKKNILNF
jgi:hypothetical protein